MLCKLASSSAEGMSSFFLSLFLSICDIYMTILLIQYFYEWKSLIHVQISSCPELSVHTLSATSAIQGKQKRDVCLKGEIGSCPVETLLQLFSPIPFLIHSSEAHLGSSVCCILLALSGRCESTFSLGLPPLKVERSRKCWNQIALSVR